MLSMTFSMARRSPQWIFTDFSGNGWLTANNSRKENLVYKRHV